jgi:hypothetical protein
MMLQPDGTVMVQGGANSASKNWYRLAPDSTGSYTSQQAQWTTLTSMNVGRLFFASNVLPSGQVFVEGGEYSTAGGDTNAGEIYNPLANNGAGQWTTITNSQPGVGARAGLAAP